MVAFFKKFGGGKMGGNIGRRMDEEGSPTQNTGDRREADPSLTEDKNGNGVPDIKELAEGFLGSFDDESTYYNIASQAGQFIPTVGMPVSAICEGLYKDKLTSEQLVKISSNPRVRRAVLDGCDDGTCVVDDHTVYEAAVTSNSSLMTEISHNKDMMDRISESGAGAAGGLALGAMVANPIVGIPLGIVGGMAGQKLYQTAFSKGLTTNTMGMLLTMTNFRKACESQPQPRTRIPGMGRKQQAEQNPEPDDDTLRQLALLSRCPEKVQKQVEEMIGKVAGGEDAIQLEDAMKMHIGHVVENKGKNRISAVTKVLLSKKVDDMIRNELLQGEAVALDLGRREHMSLGTALGRHGLSSEELYLGKLTYLLDTVQASKNRQHRAQQAHHQGGSRPHINDELAHATSTLKSSGVGAAHHADVALAPAHGGGHGHHGGDDIPSLSA